LEPKDITLPGPEGREARRRIWGREDAVLIDIEGYLCRNYPGAREHQFDLALVLFQDKRSRTDDALFEITISPTPRVGNHRDRFCHILGKNIVLVPWVHADGIFVGRFHAVDVLEGKRLHALLARLRSST